jgi:choline kinase
MKAIILAAGEGKRLHPLTNDKPKSLVEIWGKSLLTRQLEQLATFGITDITVVTGYCKEKIAKLGVSCVFNEQYNSTNMVFSLSKVLPTLLESKAKHTLILYGDIAYSDSHLQALIETSSTAHTVLLGNTEWFELWSQRLDEPLSDAETFQFDDNLRLLDIGKVPDSLAQVQAQYMGMIRMDTTFLRTVLSSYIAHANTAQSRNMYMTDLIQQLVENDYVHVKLVAGSWIEIDTIEDYTLYANKIAADFGL